MRGTALIEFALAWPVALLLVLGGVEVALWASESLAARAAVLAGARAATVAGASPDTATVITIRALQPSVFGAKVVASCDRGGADAELRVCAHDLGSQVDVSIDGSVPSLAPLVSGRGLPISAHVVVRKELFEP